MKNLNGLISIIVFILLLSPVMSKEKDADITISNEIIRDFILNNPEIILESLKLYEEKINNEQKNTSRSIIENELIKSINNGSDYIGGNPNGKITMIEFIDYRCGYCRKAHSEVKTLLKDNPEIRFVIKEFPILGEQSIMASKASISILIHQGKLGYENFTKKLLEYNGTINNDSITQLIEINGGDTNKIKSTMESEQIYKILNSNYLIAKKLKIAGTPTFIIGTEIIRGYKDINTLQNIINIEKQAL